MKISKVARQIPASGIRVFFDLVLGMKDVISLGVGEPDFVTPWNVRERAIDSLEKGYTSYTSNKGMIELRTAVSKYLKTKYSLDYDPEEEVLITVGVSEGSDLAFRAIVDPGQKVLVPDGQLLPSAFQVESDPSSGQTVTADCIFDNPIYVQEIN